VTWLGGGSAGDAPFERALGIRRDLFELHRALVAELWADGTVDPVILELCRLRVAQLHGDEGELRLRYEPAVAAGLDEAKVAALHDWPTSPLFSPAERTCIALAEKMTIDVHGVDDDEAAAVTAALPPDQTVALTLAIGLFDGLARFRAILDLDPSTDAVTVVPAPMAGAGTVH
jgi:alkylhydroperoxidase family enzyme